MNKIKRFLCVLLSSLLVYTPQARAFDPVNDDTDIFLANPDITAFRPNVLIMLDNSGNWNTPFVNEKNALVQVFNSLTEEFNVGLMMFAETGSPNDNTDGGYVRYHVRQMTGGNRTALASLVNGLDRIGDRSNNVSHGQALFEAYRYYAGLTSVASHGKIKTDFTGNAAGNPHAAPLAGPHALPANPTASSLYNSPIVDGCQKNFIILISNGPPDRNVREQALMERRLAELTGRNPPDVIGPLTPTGEEGNWSDEMAKYMANADVNASLDGVQNVFTYVVEINPGTTGRGPGTTALMKSTATHGKGKYFGVTSDASGSAIVDALNAIFSEIQAVNSVFAATTLPVSVNVRGTNLNQVYIGVFRPDANKSPRWLGNLKLYELALDSTTNTVFLADAEGNAAEDPLTGFIRNTATSFWTTNSGPFWSFLDPEQNNNNPTDIPDGNLVEKGGAAQQTRIAFANAEGSSPLRKVYTCTDGGTFTAQCTPGSGGNPGSSLSATPFADNNTDISGGLLALETRLVSPLTAFQIKPVTTLTDRRTATLTNAADPIAVTSLDNGATTRTVTNLSTATPKVVSSLTGLTSGEQTIGVSTIARVTGNTYRVQTAVTTLPGGYIIGATVAISGVSGNTSFNGSFSIAAVGTNTFDFSCPGCGATSGTGGTATVNAISQSTIATATLPDHGFTSGQQVTITGASPSQFNGTFGITVLDVSPGVPDPDRFTYIMSSAAGDATVAEGFAAITAAGNTTTATATTSVAHGFLAGTSVTITGASPNEYNGTFTIVLVPSTTSFTYNLATAIGPNTASPVHAHQGGGTTVTVTAPGHLFTDGTGVTIANSDIAGYNGTFPIFNAAGDTFQFTTATVLPANNSTTVTASTGTLPIVTATVNNHGFNVGDSVVIESTSSPADPNHPGTYTILTVPGANTFTYSTGAALAAPSGGFTARPPTLSTRAISSVTDHGYATGQEVVINGASPADYNGTRTVSRVVDANTFEYEMSTAPGPNTSTAVTSSIKTTTARATSVAHGFETGNTVQISGATPSVFDGTFVVARVDNNTFTYVIASEQGDATGAITATASGASGADRTNLIRWVRGEDNFEDENANSSTTDIRASVHGDVLHSRPAVLNYNRFDSDNDVYVFYGSNDGIFRAVKGGFATDAADSAALQPGQEAWGFIPQEFFGELKRLRDNSPIISSTFKKPYFMDGPIGVLIRDVNNDGKIVAADGDRAILYIALRRGGRFIYALDVSDPVDPKFMWKIDNTTPGFSELGQTWSHPTVIEEGFNGYPKPVLIFGGGYDPAVEDIPPTDITAFTDDSVTTAAGPTNRTMGRAIYVVDALTGELKWSAGKFAGATTPVSEMHFAIPSDVTVIRNESGLALNRAYVGDTGGNVWRMDFRSSDPANPDVENLNGTLVTKIGSIADHSSIAGGLRKFVHPPDVVGQTGFDAVLIGSGDREHPFDTAVVNRFYMFKDKGGDLGPATGKTFHPDGTTTSIDPVITEFNPDGTPMMFDATDNCIQDCLDPNDQLSAQTALGNLSGWYITLGAGEKVIGPAISIAGTTFFNTNQPSADAGGGVCGSNLGIARQYQVGTADATAVNDLNLSGGLTGADRSLIHAGGGYLPPPVHVVVMLEGKPVEAILSGVQVTTPTGATLAARLRKFWYKEVDQP